METDSREWFESNFTIHTFVPNGEIIKNVIERFFEDCGLTIRDFKPSMMPILWRCYRVMIENRRGLRKVDSGAMSQKKDRPVTSLLIEHFSEEINKERKNLITMRPAFDELQLIEFVEFDLNLTRESNRYQEVRTRYYNKTADEWKYDGKHDWSEEMVEVYSNHVVEVEGNIKFDVHSFFSAKDEVSRDILRIGNERTDDEIRDRIRLIDDILRFAEGRDILDKDENEVISICFPIYREAQRALERLKAYEHAEKEKGRRSGGESLFGEGSARQDPIAVLSLVIHIIKKAIPFVANHEPKPGRPRLGALGRQVKRLNKEGISVRQISDHLREMGYDERQWNVRNIYSILQRTGNRKSIHKKKL